MCDVGRASVTIEDDDDNTTMPCLQCGQTLDLTKLAKVIQHSGAHILNDPKLARDIPLCGFCLRPLPSCQVRLRKTGAGKYQLDFEASQCSLIRSGCVFKYEPASKSSNASPCSNVPIVCPVCPPGSSHATEWRYNLQEHFRLRHPSRLSSSSSLWQISESETSLMMAEWQKIVERQVRPVVLRKKKDANALKLAVSTAHAASLALSCVSVAVHAPGVNSSLYFLARTIDTSSTKHTTPPQDHEAPRTDTHDEDADDANVNRAIEALDAVSLSDRSSSTLRSCSPSISCGSDSGDSLSELREPGACYLCMLTGSRLLAS